MKYLIFSDVHSNLPALEAVIKSAPKKDFDRVVCLGDVVGYNPYPNECLEQADGYVDSFVPGNHDIAVYNIFCRSHGKQSSAIYTDFEFNNKALFAARWNAEQLTEKSFGILERIAHQDYAFKEDGRIFVHSTPFEPERMDYVEDKGALFDFLNHSELGSSIAFAGHTHEPQIYTAIGKGDGCWETSGERPCFLKATDKTFEMEKNHPDLYVRQKKIGNPITKKIDLSRCDKALLVVPSVGQPRDGMNYTGYATYDSDKKEVCFVRIPYPMQSLLDKIKDSVESGLPDYRHRMERGI